MTGLVHFIPVTFIMLLLARVVYGMPPLEHPVSLYLFVLVGLMAFRAIGSIVGAVANSMQESQIIVQLLYFPMLFLGGATFPLSVMPNWLQTVAQFIPSTYLSEGLIGILQGHETLFGQSLERRGAALHHLHRDLPGLETVSLGKRRKDARVGEAVDRRGIDAVSSGRRVAGAVEGQHGQGSRCSTARCGAITAC